MNEWMWSGYFAKNVLTNYLANWWAEFKWELELFAYVISLFELLTQLTITNTEYISKTLAPEIGLKNHTAL